MSFGARCFSSCTVVGAQESVAAGGSVAQEGAQTSCFEAVSSSASAFRAAALHRVPSLRCAGAHSFLSSADSPFLQEDSDFASRRSAPRVQHSAADKLSTLEPRNPWSVSSSPRLAQYTSFFLCMKPFVCHPKPPSPHFKIMGQRADGKCIDVNHDGILWGNMGDSKKYPTWYANDKNVIVWEESPSCPPGKVRFHFVDGEPDTRPLNNMPDEDGKLHTYHARTFTTVPPEWLDKMKKAMRAKKLEDRCEDVPTAHMTEGDGRMRDPWGNGRDKDDEVSFQIANGEVGGACKSS